MEKKRLTIIEHVALYAKSQPDKKAVLTPDGSVTYLELFDYARGYAKYLLSFGLKKGDKVVLRSRQTIDYVIQYLGIHLAGGIVTSLERNIPDSGIIEIAKKINANAIITDNTKMKDLYAAAYIPLGDVQAVAKEHINDDIELKFPALSDSADILFTTGTTGSSKGAELLHDTILATAENHIIGCKYKPDTVIVVPAPLNHAVAIRNVFTSFVNGSTVYILNGMTNVKSFFNALDYCIGSVACCLPPAAIRTLFALTNDRIGEYRDKIDFIFSASSPLSEADKRKLCSLLPNTRLYNCYGFSETSFMSLYDYNEYPGKENCIGKTLPGMKIIIVDDEHHEIQATRDNPGLIACKGAVNMKAYVNEPVLTAEILENDTIYTSDIGYIDDEGFAYVIGRKGDVINVGGLKVAPAEVESAALEYDGIVDCICIAVADKITTNALKLLVVIKEGTELNIKSLNTFLAKSLEAYKIPRFYEVVDKVERTFNGKINRKYYR
jgi:acyl-CoA synthetase (AMP-forming)/AMP-acid ligase II